MAYAVRFRAGRAYCVMRTSTHTCGVNLFLNYDTTHSLTPLIDVKRIGGRVGWLVTLDPVRTTREARDVPPLMRTKSISFIVPASSDIYIKKL